MSIAGHGSPSIEPTSLPHGPGAGTLLPNLDGPSETGHSEPGHYDHSENELAPDGFRQSPLPHKRRKTAQSSSAISAVFSSSSVSQASPPLKRPRTLESASFVGGDDPLRSDSESPLGWASSPKHALGLTLFKAEPSKPPHISSLTSHGAAPSSTMPSRQHDEYPAKMLLDARQDKRAKLKSHLGEFDPLGISRRREAPRSTGTSTSPSLVSSVSRPPNLRPSGGRSIRTSTQLLTQRSKQRAELGQFGAEYVEMGGIHSAFSKPVDEAGVSAYRASAHELELWTDANVSPVVFGERKFAARLSEREVKDAVTFNLRYLLQDMGQLSGPQSSEQRPSLTAMPERSRKNRIALILQDALGPESQTPTEETDDDFSTDVPNDLHEGLEALDTPTESTDTDDHNLKLSIRPEYEPHSKPGLYNTHSLSFQKPRRSFLPPMRNTPSSATVKKNIIREHISNLLPNGPSISTHDSIQSTRSPTPHVHEPIDAFISPLRTPGKEHPTHPPKEFPEEPFQAPKEPVSAVREPSVGVIELFSPMIVDEDPNATCSPPTPTQPPLHENLTSTNSQTPRESPSYRPLSRDDSTPSSLFGPPETSMASPPPSEVFLHQAIPDVPASSSLSSEAELEVHSKGLSASSGGKFFHECSIQSSEGSSNSRAETQGITFRSSSNPLNVRFRDVTQWPSPATPEDHPYLQEARSLMVIAKLREELLPFFVEDDEVESEEDEDSGIESESESEIEDEDELDASEHGDSIESSGTHDELDTLSALPSTPTASGQNDMSLARWDPHSVTPARHDQGLHHRVHGWESISTSGARGRGINTEHRPIHVPPIALSSSADDRGSDHAGDEHDQINHEDQLEDWTASLQTLVKGKRVLLPEELLNLKTVLNAVYTHSPTISASSELAQTVLQVAKLETKDVPNQDSLGLRVLARKSVRAWGLSTRTKI